MGEENENALTLIAAPLEEEAPAQSASAEELEILEHAYARYIKVLGERERPKVVLTFGELQSQEKKALHAMLFGLPEASE